MRITDEELVAKIRRAGVYTDRVTKIALHEHTGAILTCDVSDHLARGWYVIGYWHPGERYPRSA